ncbi:MAG: nuclease A inhibitor family protein [bacterium]|nr:nuclease A inhibitor family protein [bacterium]
MEIPKKKFASVHNLDDAFERELKAACRPLTFISETDAEVTPFTAEKPSNRSLSGYLASLEITSDNIEEVGFEEFFDRLTSEKDWHGPREKKRSQQWSKLRGVLEENLESLRVIRVGRIQLEIFIAGMDATGRLAGVKTKAIET